MQDFRPEDMELVLHAELVSVERLQLLRAPVVDITSILVVAGEVEVGVVDEVVVACGCAKVDLPSVVFLGGREDWRWGVGDVMRPFVVC